jgi:sugar lactone lactonase YvrE
VISDSFNLRCVVPAGDHCGEGATWDAATGRLYWTDVNRFLVHCLEPGGAVRSWFFDEPCVAMALTDRPGTLLLAIGSRLLLWQPASDTRTPHGFALDDWPVARLNEGKAGPAGEFWVGSMANNVAADGTAGAVPDGCGRLFRITAGAAPVVFKSGIGISNTLCFTPDARQLYFGDTLRNTVWRYDYERQRGISGETPFFAGYDRGVPDGSAIDADGFLWNCRFGGGCIVRVAVGGAIDRVVELPVSNVTTCAFGGPDLKTLYITTATILLDRHERLAGSLFALDAPVAGVPAHHYQIDA